MRGRQVTLVDVHPTAVIDPGAELGRGVQVGPYAVIGPGVLVGDGCRIGPHAVLERNVRLAPEVTLGAGVVLGGAPQDVKYREEETWVEVGPRTIIREYSTVHRATAATGTTRVGADCFLMTYVHVAHDCQVGDGVTIANSTQLSGHIVIEERATVSGLCALHQFITIGTHAFVGGSSRLPQDIPPYVTAVGNPVRLFGLNTVGLTRAGFPAATLTALKHAYRLLFNSDRPRREAMAELADSAARVPEVARLLAFVAGTRRGVPA
ncbi:MAG: acyl-ACP--UDP-N-acetylglucosamine O-acyltransferase [Gemmatimonadetes bacterium]|nr:acyl-ACP--UDP-N-acetylglucosamine O-acyltransferase [Gemmatimonadota bacterium]MBK7783358.1 acyl-ACP--UDP-N-acetylglucosamine O-acyltransferase [Gemmatimonadota bacterium]